MDTMHAPVEFIASVGVSFEVPEGRGLTFFLAHYGDRSYLGERTREDLLKDVRVGVPLFLSDEDDDRRGLLWIAVVLEEGEERGSFRVVSVSDEGFEPEEDGGIGLGLDGYAFVG